MNNTTHPTQTQFTNSGVVGAQAPRLEIVVPVYNEQRVLRHSILRLYRHLVQMRPAQDFRITIADNASDDDTPRIARELAGELPLVAHLRLDRKGRGRALRAAWSASDAEVLAYMDVDLSTDLAYLGRLVDPLLAGEADIAIGSRLAPGAQVTRGLRREVISRSYNQLLRRSLGVGFSDAQCGFKALRRHAAQLLLDQVQDDRWFFDTELLYVAERAQLTIHEVPVRWVDDPSSTVHILATAIEDLRGIRRLRQAAHAERRLTRKLTLSLPSNGRAA